MGQVVGISPRPGREVGGAEHPLELQLEEQFELGPRIDLGQGEARIGDVIAVVSHAASLAVLSDVPPSDHDDRILARGSFETHRWFSR